MFKLVSTLICTYNAEGFISKTLDSVIHQTYKNQEILVRDDWSKDKTIKILKDRAKKDKRIKIYTSHKEWKKLGPYWGLNFLMDNSKWEYVAIQDHDDIWHFEKIEKQIAFLEKNSEYVWCWTGTLMYFGISRLWYLVDDVFKNTNNVIHTSLVFRNQWFRYDEKNVFLWDRYFMEKILTKWKNNIKVIPDFLTLHYYKETNDNYSELWFKINKKNIKRYFDVYEISFFSLIYLIYLIVSKIFPGFLKKWITFNISLRNKLKSKKHLELNQNIKDLLRYY